MSLTNDDLFIRISHDDERDVSFVTEDENRFFLSVSETIAAGRIHIQRRDELNETAERVRALQKRAAMWWKSHSPDIKAAYLSYRQGRFTFLVIQKGVPLNEKLEQDLIELDIQLAKSLEVRPLSAEVMLLPECDDACIHTFVPKADRRLIPHAVH